MKKILSVLLIFMATGVFAQQEPLFSQYMFNKLALNPGYAGSRDVLSADVLYRYQWVNIDGAPKTLNLSVSSPLHNENLALGLNLYNDVIGPTVNQGALATFAYRLIFPHAKLSFGLRAGVKYTDIIWSKVNPADLGDPSLLPRLKNNVVPNADFGIYYYADRYYFGLSSGQLLQNNMNIVTVNGEDEFTRLMRHFYGMAGVAIPVSENVLLKPSILLKYVKNAPAQMDLNMSVLFAKTFWLGASYRTREAVALMTEFQLSKNLRLGYSYDIWFNQLKAYNQGSHEIRLGFDFDLFSRMTTPRYF